MFPYLEDWWWWHVLAWCVENSGLALCVPRDGYRWQVTLQGRFV